MITLYKPNETDFTHNGIGILDNNIYEAEIEEILNGVYTLRFKYPLFSPHGLDIIGQSIIKAPTPDGEQLFRVANPHPTNGEVQVFCYHIFYDLVDNFIEDTNIVGKSGMGALDQVKGALQYPTKFDFYSDVAKTNNARLVRKNPVEFLLDGGQDNSFLRRWGGELLRDNFNVRMLNNRGRDRGVVIQHKKDLLGYEADVDWQSVITKIMPQGADELLLPEKYVTSTLVNKYVNPKIRKIDFPDVKAKIGDASNDDDALPLPDALNKLRAEALAMFNEQHVDQPLATYKIKFQELSQTEEYKGFAVMQRVYMGDTVTVQHLEEGIDVKTKVVSYKYDPLNDEYTDITLGNYKESFTDVANKVDRMQDNLDGLETSFLEKAKDRATDLINSGFGGHVRIYPERILIMDTDKESTAEKVWQWNINGLGYSKTGINGPYGLAMTMDGSIVADFITTGKLNAGMVQTGFNEYGNSIKMMPDGLQAQINGKKSMELNNLGQLMVYDDSTNRIGMLGYQFKNDNPMKGVTMNIEKNRFLSLSVRDDFSGAFTPFLEIVDNNIYGLSGVHVWKDFLTNGNKIVLNKSSVGFTDNWIQELSYADNTKRLDLISNAGVDFVYKNSSNDTLTTIGGMKRNNMYCNYIFYANGGIALSENDTTATNGIYKSSSGYMVIGSSNKIMLGYTVSGTVYPVVEVVGKNDWYGWGNLDMNNWQIKNASIARTISNDNAPVIQSFLKSSLAVNKPAEKELYAPMSSTEMFTHIGEGQTVDGLATIDLPIYFQNETENYHVFISKYGKGDIWVSERNMKSFVVESDNDISFSYEIKITKQEKVSSPRSFLRASVERSSIFDNVPISADERTAEPGEVNKDEIIREVIEDEN
ncbi:endopeptidase [Bacillus toyonensis]|uniref:phage tail spike protein n=1 Tax=Bacillus toyonensis TaxID=155322 RepID=UPI000BFCF5EA|nr:phage tail spike protein [Bacillus toyonensis]PHD00645.1 endopeptidase [Bacillus toyonensis]